MYLLQIASPGSPTGFKESGVPIAGHTFKSQVRENPIRFSVKEL
jgi:hypothetical protein